MSKELNIKLEKAKKENVAGYHIVITTFGEEVFYKITRNNGSEIENKEEKERMMKIITARIALSIIDKGAN